MGSSKTSLHYFFNPSIYPFRSIHFPPLLPPVFPVSSPLTSSPSLNTNNNVLFLSFRKKWIETKVWRREIVVIIHHNTTSRDFFLSLSSYSQSLFLSPSKNHEKILFLPRDFRRRNVGRKKGLRCSFFYFPYLFHFLATQKQRNCEEWTKLFL